MTRGAMRVRNQTRKSPEKWACWRGGTCLALSPSPRAVLDPQSHAPIALPKPGSRAC
jgi:hypothetical protein